MPPACVLLLINVSRLRPGGSLFWLLLNNAVCYNGELHVDGGYLNNVPVAEMYAHGVGSCIVVDVEDKEGPWKSLQSYDGGVSGWKLLWDRWCPLPSLQFGEIPSLLSSDLPPSLAPPPLSPAAYK